jgi:hypothetical protein
MKRCSGLKSEVAKHPQSQHVAGRQTQALTRVPFRQSRNEASATMAKPQPLFDRQNHFIPAISLGRRAGEWLMIGLGILPGLIATFIAVALQIGGWIW